MPIASRVFVAALAFAAAGGVANAQGTPDTDARNYPNRAIRIIVPFRRAGRPTSSRASSARK
jgi:tripartite-type tricarboxylate transporter receptor subunit TctC